VAKAAAKVLGREVGREVKVVDRSTAKLSLRHLRCCAAETALSLCGAPFQKSQVPEDKVDIGSCHASTSEYMGGHRPA
jgi:hypothetical protein